MTLVVEYAEATPDGWSRQILATWESEQDEGDTLRLWGDCPTCGHPSDFTIVAAEYAGGFEKGSRLANNRVVIYCRCSFPHPGRPDNKEGCGRQAYFDLVSER
jgi:hypothetical protein